jgi:2-desacetyl-2-hydroxyethyl bacteriochlorophyllide A dehydrogenase
MFAAVLTQLGGPLEIEEVNLTPLLQGQVLVKVIKTGICGAQLQEIRGLKGNAKFIPHLLGHEGVGEVLEVGPEVRKVAIGDKVVMHWRKGSGFESEFPKYIFRGKEIFSGKVTTFSEKTIVSENRVTKVSPDLDDSFLALLGCAVSTAYCTLKYDAEVKPGSSIAILGTGGVGMALVSMAKLLGCSRILAFDKDLKKAERSMRLGANEFQTSFFSGNEVFDVIVDTTGSPDLLAQGFEKLAPSGRLILVGQPNPGLELQLKNVNSFFEGNGKRIIASQGGGFNPDNDIPILTELFRQGLIPHKDLISHEIPLAQINQGIAMISSGDASRVVLEISG